MKGRIEKLAATLKGGEAFLITNLEDIFYFTGIYLSSGTLLVGKKSFLLVDGRYFDVCKKQSPVAVYLAKDGRLFELLEGVKILIADQSSAYASIINLKEEARKYGVEIKVQPSFVQPFRAIKDEVEIAFLKEASCLGLEGFDFAVSLLKPGIREVDVALELEYFWRKKGAQGVAFDPIIAFGKNSAMPHHRAGNTILKENDIILIDIGVKKNHYHSDMTRTFFIGNPAFELKKIHGIVFQALESALLMLRPGVLIKDVDRAAREVIEKAGYGEYFIHSLGHGIGLGIHEFPFLRSSPPFGDVGLQAGMVVTIEPGIYLSDLGGVRLEDTVVITNDGYENLTTRKYA